jgi:DNA-binding PadR family transcriptional regulator
MHQPLTPAVFHILLALSLKERHGYEIMKQVEEDSGGRITLGPGTLYTAIRRLLDDGWIVEVASKEEGDERRKYYRLSSKGKAVLSEETERLSQVAGLAQHRLGFSFKAAA